jgi:hypothetical protein
MYEFLREALTESTKIHMALQPKQYTVNSTANGPCYLKAILLTFYYVDVETNATNFHLRELLHNLPKKIKNLKPDVPASNLHVREMVTDLASGGGVSDNLIVYLFNAYLAVEDHNFHKFIERKKEDYDDGREEITVQALMTTAETKFNQLNQSKQWRAKTPEEQKLIALMAQLQEAKDKLAQLSKGKGSSNSSKSASAKSNTPSNTLQSSSTAGSNNKKGKDLQSRYPEWCFQRNGKETKLVKDERMYWWCNRLNMWAQHEPKDCWASKQTTNPKAKDDKSTKKDSSKQKSALTLAKALVAIREDSDDSDDK